MLVSLYRKVNQIHVHMVKGKPLNRARLCAIRGLQPTRLLRPWDFPAKSTGVGCHVLLRGSS